MKKETPIETLKVNGEKIMCDSPVLHEPSVATFIQEKVSSKNRTTLGTSISSRMLVKISLIL